MPRLTILLDGEQPEDHLLAVRDSDYVLVLHDDGSVNIEKEWETETLFLRIIGEHD